MRWLAFLFIVSCFMLFVNVFVSSDYVTSHVLCHLMSVQSDYNILLVFIKPVLFILIVDELYNFSIYF